MLGIYDSGYTLNEHLRRQASRAVPEDSHRRDANEIEADRQIAARRRLLERFLPFVRLEDQNLEPIVLLTTVGTRIFDASQVEARRLNSGPQTITKT